MLITKQQIFAVDKITVVHIFCPHSLRSLPCLSIWRLYLPFISRACKIMFGIYSQMEVCITVHVYFCVSFSINKTLLHINQR